MITTRDFDKEELSTILKHATALISRGYFTGINFIQSEKELPEESILIHFLHDNRKHIKHIQTRVASYSILLPRYTFYLLDNSYFEKINFEEEYKHAQFLDEDFNQITLQDAKKKRKETAVFNQELDLLVPLEESALETTIKAIKDLNVGGPEPWLDPVIIIKSEVQLLTLPGFINPKSYVNIRRNKEELYTLLPDIIHEEALKRYIRKLCINKPNINRFDENSIVFGISQVNEEFFKYILKQIRSLNVID